MNFTIGIYLSHLFEPAFARIKSSSDCNDCWRKERWKKESLSDFLETPTIRDGKAVQTQTREKETKNC